MAHFNWDKILVETDASDLILTEVLSQYDDDGLLRLVAFYSKKHSLVEPNNEIYNKKLMVIVGDFEELEGWVSSAEHTVLVLWDNQNLE